jgi:hypothetical protein
MKKWLGSLTLIAFLGVAVLADDRKGPEIQVIDDKISMRAEAVALGRLLRLFDMATGLKSTAPPDLANRNISVQFTNLSFSDAVQKIFEGATLDYVVVQGQGIMVTAASQAGPPTATAGAPYNPPPSEPAFDEQPFFPGGAGAANGQPFPPQMQGNYPPQPGMQGQPAMIQTPFGPIPNPRANQQNNMPMSAPGSNQPFGLANPAENPPTVSPISPFGDGAVPSFNPNLSQPNAPPANPFGNVPNGMPGMQGVPGQAPTAPVRRPPGQ